MTMIAGETADASYHWRKGTVMSKAPLETELRVFADRRQEWVRTHLGKFVVIQDETVLDFFDQYEDAFRAGVKRFGADRNFLIKQVWKTEPVYFVA
jgi:hypothetical protein